MDGWSFLIDVLVLLTAALVLGGLLERLRQSAIVGYLLAGMLVGPNALEWVAGAERVEVLAELGVALLLFTIGLEFSWRRLRAFGAVALAGGTLQVVVTAALGTAVALAFVDPASAAAIGAAVALSSTAAVIRALASRAELDSQHGRQALAILLVQDIAVVPLVLIVALLGGTGTPAEVLGAAGKTLGLAALLIAAFFVLFDWLVPKLLGARMMATNRELPILLAVATAVGSAWAAHRVGISPALGAFVAGMLLGGSPFAVSIRADVSSLRTLLVTLFFASAGMLADPVWIVRHWWIVGLVVLAIVCGKALIIWFLLRRLRISHGHAITTGLCLAQVGEFSFLVAATARGTVIDESVFMLLVSVTIVTLLLTPYLVQWAPWLGARWQMIFGPGASPGLPAHGESDEPVVVIIGYGPSGRAVADAVARHGADVHVIDLNPQIVEIGAQCGFAGLIGDATQPDVLEEAGVPRAAAVVITLPDSATVRQIIRRVRSRYSATPIVARGRYHRYHRTLAEAGADVVVDEETQVGLRLAGELRRVLRGADQSPRP